MKHLFFDTETTGMADFKSKPEAEHQPRIVQIGAILQDDETMRILGEINLIIRPAKFLIPKEASDIHGITTEMALDCGVPLLHALEAFCSLLKQCQECVAHNAAFDRHMLTGSASRMCVPLADVPFFCTMNAMTDVCKIPNPRFPDRYKWPKLQEAHVFAFGNEFAGAHDAMADVRACRDVFYWLKQRPEAQS